LSIGERTHNRQRGKVIAGQVALALGERLASLAFGSVVDTPVSRSDTWFP